MRILVASSVFLALGGLLTPAAAAPQPKPVTMTVDCDRGPTLQPLIAALPAGSVLTIKGRCIGTVVIDKDLTLAGGNGAVLDGNGNGPVLTVLAGAYVVVDNLVITGGAANAATAVGGIANAGHLTLIRSRVNGNTAIGSALAIGGINSVPAATAVLKMDRTEVNDNLAQVVIPGAGPALSTGGIRTEGAVTLDRSEVRRNRAFVSSAGANRAFGGISMGPGAVAFDRVDVTDNVAESVHTGLTGAGLLAGAVGGVVRLSNVGEIVFDRTAIARNVATARSAVGSAAAGGLNIRNTRMRHSSIEANSAEAGTLAHGAFSNFDHVVTLESTTVRGNRATAIDPGGLAAAIITGFFTNATTTLDKSLVIANEAVAATATGGLHQAAAGTYVLTKSTVEDNSPMDCNFACTP